ncbi:hypothetical protein QFZ76_004378 [Streptomyces sp. V4I2]|nr:hypothetical protein [Streptomyces sp. V4I2]
MPSTVVAVLRVASEWPSSASPSTVFRSQKLTMSWASWPFADVLVHFPAGIATAASVSASDSPSLWARRNASSYFM